MRKLLGFLSYYRQYIQDFSCIAKPLYDLMAGPDLLASNQTVTWTKEHQNRLDMLIHRLTSPAVMAFPDLQNHLCFIQMPPKQDWELYCIKSRMAS